ncbi:malto-oligosyltrehalose synthase [Microbacterium terricola]|uniref:Malto-oligosyltrehalose synthase n=1 Tax=Microbacterium terricola TaxID=344163 RepID=A0ABM8DYZ7_9MICO|nr:malto-oligosyltrehalose synthase [Microbacterium terricola]UYK41382.1 malto-oligosyltrehalose synthase [Microbacterium terricola]BDV30834.1 malto-oligosyltrehalose synthase [Microbacterium terricola]
MEHSSTYRLQIRADFDLDAAACVAGYLHDLGVEAAYLSPLLQATEGSDHGYDVTDPTRVDASRGGADALERFAREARAAGLGIVVDIVPNHMGIAQPEQNAWWWDVLTHGAASTYAEAFDIDWAAGGGRVRLPILGAELPDALADLVVDADAGVVRYFDHVLPLAPESLGGLDPADVAGVLGRQHWEPVFWRHEATTLNYRRFFTVTGLAGVRVEVPWVFDRTHAEVLRWVREGLVDGLRIDHPDGLRDPGAYLARLDAALRGAGSAEPYVVVEKILEPGEELPGWWATDGTTGYDALGEIARVLIDPRGEEPLDALDAMLRAETGLPPSEGWTALTLGTKRAVADTVLAPEIARLVRDFPAGLLDEAQAADALAEILAGFPVYRTYLPAGRRVLDEAADTASARRPDLADAIRVLLPVLADPAQPVSRRFEQTAGPVMAKGVEDAAFYRATRLGTLTEVGGDPAQFSLDVHGFHAARSLRHAHWPRAMTTLSTHDTKRGADVRARLAVLAEIPERWAEVLGQLRAVATTGHGPFDALLWQAIVGSWPSTPERLREYAVKAAREAGEATTWTDPDQAFEARTHALIDAAFGAARPVVDAFVAEIAWPGWSNALSAALLHLTGPGVPDVYQGTELWDLSLVDPDNRRPVDYAARRALLARIDEGPPPTIDADGVAKLLVTARALRLRRDRPGLFTRYTPMTVVGDAAAHAIAYDRGGALTVATRLPVGLHRRGGWGDTALLRHAGPTRDVLTGRTFRGGELPMGELLEIYPVALLVPEEEP